MKDVVDLIMSRQFLVGDADLVNCATASASTCDGDDDLIKVPFIVRVEQPPPDLVGQHLAEPQRPLPHRLVAHDDTAGDRHLLDHAQAEWKPKIQPNRVVDDLGRKAVACVARCHAARLSVLTRLRKQPSCQFDGAALGNKKSACCLSARGVTSVLNQTWSIIPWFSTEFHRIVEQKIGLYTYYVKLLSPNTTAALAALRCKSPS